MPVTSLWGSTNSMYGNELYGQWPFYVFPAPAPFTQQFTSLIGNPHSQMAWVLFGQMTPLNWLATPTSLIGEFRDWQGNIIPGMPIPSNVKGVYVTQSFLISQSVKPGAILNRAAANTIVYRTSETYTPYIAVSNTIVYTQSLSYSAIRVLIPSNTMHLTQTIVPGGTHGFNLSNVLAMTSVSVPGAILNRTIVQPFNMVSLGIPGAILNFSVSNTIVYTSSALHPKNASTSNTLVLTGLAVCHKTATVSAANTLHLVSVGSSVGVRNLVASNTLTYLNLIQHKTALGVVWTTPPAVAVVIPKQRVVTIQVYSNQSPRPLFGGPVLGPSGVIVLPDPVLGDTEENLGTVAIKYSINGNSKITIKNSYLTKLTYSFELRRMKSLELRQFLINNDTSLFLLTNWKGEVWLCNIVNAPLNLIAKSRWGENPSGCDNREQIDVTLEFEGVKVGG